MQAVLWPELPRLTPQGCPHEHPTLREPSGHPPRRGTTLGYFSRVAGSGYAQPPTLAGPGRMHALFCRGAFPSSLTRLVFARACLSASRRYSRPSGLGSTPHRGRFDPDATPTLGLGRSILFNHPLSRRMAKCSRPTVFRVATPTHRSLPTHYDPGCAFTLRGAEPQGWSVAVSRARKALPRASRLAVPPSSSHRPACVHLSERFLAHADYSCRHGSPVDSTAQGVTPDFIHPPFGPTGLPPGRFAETFVTISIRIEWTTSCTVSDLPASTVPHLAFWASMSGRDAQRFLRRACG
jgi:hypothetical protein